MYFWIAFSQHCPLAKFRLRPDGCIMRPGGRRMHPQMPSLIDRLYSFVVVQPEPPGQHTAAVVGLPEIRATAVTREEAIELVRATFRAWLASGQLVHVER